jgi:hypothetical protein
MKNIPSNFKNIRIVTVLIQRFFNWYFKAYDPKGFVLQQKARILFFILLLMLGLDVGFFLKVLLFADKLEVSVLVVTLINFFSLCGVMWVLQAGHFSVAGHALIGLTQGILWIALFMLDIPLVSRLDGIFMIFTVFTLCALIVNRYRRIIALYFLVNSALLILLAFYLQSVYAWSTAATVGMIGDNIISLACIAFVSFSVVSINNVALRRAQRSIEAAELEAARNSHLSQTLERKVEQRTHELKLIIEELQQENAEYALQHCPSLSKNLWIDVDTEANTVLIKIRDSGCGIPQAVMGKLFKHGFTTKTDGNGFGLHSCAIYMEDMKGTIQAYSEGVGRGAEFRLRFPLSNRIPNR